MKETQSRRYQSPATRPILITRPVAALQDESPALRPQVRLSTAWNGERGASRRLVSFAWGTTVPSLRRR